MATLVQRFTDAVIRLATELKIHKTLLNGNAAGLGGLTTTDKTHLVAALNEVKAAVDTVAGQVGAQINDTLAASTTRTWSITKIQAEIDEAHAALIGAAPEALNTVFELAAALQNDPNIVATLTNGLATRLRFDAAQALNTAQKTQVCNNIGIGEPDTNFVTIIESGLA